MTGRRLIRSGVVRHAPDGCTTLLVGVPCSRCGLCPGTGGLLELPVAELPGESRAGAEEVEVSVSAAGLLAISARLFAPMLLVALGIGFLAEPTSVEIWLGLPALLVALALGRYLARRAVPRLELSVAQGDAPLARINERGRNER